VNGWAGTAHAARNPNRKLPPFSDYHCGRYARGWFANLRADLRRAMLRASATNTTDTSQACRPLCVDQRESEYLRRIVDEDKLACFLVRHPVQHHVEQSNVVRHGLKKLRVRPVSEPQKSRVGACSTSFFMTGSVSENGNVYSRCAATASPNSDRCRGTAAQKRPGDFRMCFFQSSCSSDFTR